MNRQTTVKSALADVFTGFVAFGLLVTVIATTDAKFDVRKLFFAAAALFFLAGFVRGTSGPDNPWMKGLIVAAGTMNIFSFLSLTGMALTSKPVLVLFLLVIILLTVSGAESQRSWVERAHRRSAILVSLPFAAIALGTLLLMPPVMRTLSSKEVNRPAPAFSIATLDGKVIHSADLKGRVVILSFWATSCPPCRREQPELARLYARYRQNPKVVFWAVGVPYDGDTPQKARDYAKSAKLDLPFAIVNQEADPSLGQSLGFHAIPALILLDATGHVRLVHVGYDASEHLMANISDRIEALMSEKM